MREREKKWRTKEQARQYPCSMLKDVMGSLIESITENVPQSCCSAALVSALAEHKQCFTD